MRAAPSSLRLGRREQTKARNRAVLLAAAHKVFAELGYEAASVRDIVRATDLSVGTFYQYFRDKDEAFAAVAEEALAGLRARLRAVRRDRTQRFEDRVFEAYRAFFEFVVEERPLFEVLERNQRRLREDVDEPNLALAIRELQEDLLPDLAPAVKRGVDPDYLAAAMIGTGLVVARRMLARGENDPRAAAHFCTEFSLHGLTGASTSSASPAATTRRRTA
jgi:AcrR family transcriptional regulator